MLQLKKPIYSKLAAYGHFGRKDYSWEKSDKINDLKNKFELGGVTFE